MTTQLHNTGEEWILDYAFTGGSSKPTELTVGLFQDSSDNLDDGADYNGNPGDTGQAITTEPTTGNYTQQTIAFDNTGFSTASVAGNWQATNDNTITFDTQNTSETVDAYFVLIEYDSDEAGDGGTATNHLFWTGDLEQSRNLSQIDTLDVNTVGLSLT